MSLSFDDKILGEKVDNYCSSSEDGGESDESQNGDSFDENPCVAATSNLNASPGNQVAKVIFFCFYCKRLAQKELSLIIRSIEGLKKNKK